MKYSSFIKRYYWLVLILVIGLGVIFWKIKSKEARARGLGKGIYLVKRKDLKNVLTLSGKIKADEDVVLRFKTSGRLGWVGVKEGDYVKKGQIIASLDQRELKKSLQKKLNLFMETRYDFDQTHDDYKDEIIDDEIRRILEKSQLELNNKIIDVELQDIALKYSRLSTPIEGIVTRVSSPYAGVNITPAQAEFEVVNPKTVYLSVTADQTEVVDLKKRMKGDVTLDAYPDKKLTGIIDYISFSPAHDETGNVYEVKVKFLKDNNEDLRYKLGMTGDFDVLLWEKKNVITIPLSYLRERGGKAFVYLLKEGKKVKQQVEKGAEVEGEVEILSGLNENDKISLR